MKADNQERSQGQPKGSEKPSGYWGIGIRRRAHNRTLDVTYSALWPVYPGSILESLFERILPDLREVGNGTAELELEVLRKALESTNLRGNSSEGLSEENLQALNLFKSFSAPPSAMNSASHSYGETDLIIAKLFDLNKEPKDVEEVYLRLQIISRRYRLPHTINLNGIFGLLPNLVWTTQGPVFPEDYPQLRDRCLWEQLPLPVVTHVDKFPYLVNYYIPSGVRIADGTRVRLGAYLGEGTTVMPAGYVNFNAGTKGAAMVEGRISAGVVVGEHSDVGGGGSIMGTLSGGNKHVIEIGPKCLLGANAGTGISLGFGCTIAAGTYVTAGSKVSLYDGKMTPINLQGDSVGEGKNVFKALELSGREQLLFYHDTSRGRLVCRPNPKTIDLNPQLHAGVAGS